MTTRLPWQKAFTLIETMVVMAIMLVVAGTGYYTVSQFTQSQGLNDDQRSVVTELKRVYAKATAVSYPSGCTGLTGYQVSVSVNTKAFSITALCASGNVAETRSDVLKTSQFQSTTSVTFTVSSGKVGTPVVLTIKDIIDATKTKTITVNDNGIFASN